MFFVLAKVGYFVLRPLNFLILLLIGALAARLAGWGRLANVIVTLAVAALATLGFSPVPNGLISVLEDRFPRASADAPEPDVIIVLGGSIETMVSGTREGVLALGASAERLTDVAVLARRFPQARIVFTGGAADFIYQGGSEAAVARELFLSFGIAPERMRFEDKSRDTFENAVFTRALVPPKPGEVWWLVTSAFHMPRSMGVFRANGWAEARLVPYPVDYRSVGPRYRVLLEASAQHGFESAETAIREYIGLVAYRLSGRTRDLFPAP